MKEMELFQLCFVRLAFSPTLPECSRHFLRPFNFIAELSTVEAALFMDGWMNEINK